jgi:hypothetical protein
VNQNQTDQNSGRQSATAPLRHAIGTRDSVVIEAHPRDTVICPPDEEHWHGATADQFMEYLALGENWASIA